MNKGYLAVVAFIGLSFQSALANTVLLDNARIITATDEGVIERGDVLIENGKIKQVATHITPPKGARVVDLTGKTITPGFINSESALGISEINGGANAAERATNDGAFTAAYNVADIINPFSSVVPLARRGGVTGVIVAPHSSKSHFAGQAAWLTPHDSNHLEWIKPAAAVFWDFNAVKSGRGATLPRLRAELADAALYAKDASSLKAGKLKARSWSRYDLDALAPVMRGETPLAFRVNRATDIAAIARIASTMGIQAVIVGGAEAWMVADTLAAADIPVLLDPTKNLPSNFDMVNAANENAVLLNKAGVRILIGGPTSAHDASKIRYFAGMAVANGLPRDIAIEAITRTPAQVWGLQDVGQISSGMRGDIAVWDGDPLEPMTLISQLYINGQPQSLITRQDRLEQRYIKSANDYYAETAMKE